MGRSGCCRLSFSSRPALSLFLQVAPHGSQNNFAFFMPNGTALVEIIPWWARRAALCVLCCPLELQDACGRPPTWGLSRLPPCHKCAGTFMARAALGWTSILRIGSPWITPCTAATSAWCPTRSTPSPARTRRRAKVGVPDCLPMQSPLRRIPCAATYGPSAGAGSTIAWGRDQDVALDVPTLAKALTKIARGEVRAGHRAPGTACPIEHRGRHPDTACPPTRRSSSLTVTTMRRGRFS